MKSKNQTLMEELENEVELEEEDSSDKTVMVMLPVVSELLGPIIDAVAQTAEEHRAPRALKFVIDNLKFDLESAKRGALPPTSFWQ